MFDYIDHIVDEIFRLHISSYEDLENHLKRTLPTTRERFKWTEKEVISFTADDLEFKVDYLKGELDSILLLLNQKGVRIFFDKFKQKLSYQNEKQVTNDIKLTILQGKGVKPIEKPNVYAYIDSSLVLPYYENVQLDFDLELLSRKIATLWMNYLVKVGELADKLENEYLNPNAAKEEEILVLKPTFWGMSVNLNKIWKKYFTSKNGR